MSLKLESNFNEHWHATNKWISFSAIIQSNAPGYPGYARKHIFAIFEIMQAGNIIKIIKENKRKSVRSPRISIIHKFISKKI